MHQLEIHRSHRFLKTHLDSVHFGRHLEYVGYFPLINICAFQLHNLGFVVGPPAHIYATYRDSKGYGDHCNKYEMVRH